MKYCEEYLPALSALVDGELNEAERDKVLAHLEECEGCREFFAELTAMHAAFADMEEYDAPEGFSGGVMARVHETPKKRTHRTAWVSLAACAALAVVVLGGPLRTQFGAKSASDGAAPEAAMLMMAPTAAPQECAEEEYEDEFASVQNAPMTMMTCDNAASAEKAVSETEDFAAGEIAELPRSVVFVYGAAHEDYLIEEATNFSYYADGTTAGYDLPVEKLDEFLALLDADGLTYESSVAKQATTFYVQYEEAGENG